MTKPYLVASSAFTPNHSPAGIMAIALRQLANAAPPATGMTMIEPDGCPRYISQATAERFVQCRGTRERML